MNEKSTVNQDKEDKKTSTKPNELGGVLLSSHLKIIDPKTKEVLVNKRG